MGVERLNAHQYVNGKLTVVWVVLTIRDSYLFGWGSRGLHFMTPLNQNEIFIFGGNEIHDLDNDGLILDLTKMELSEVIAKKEKDDEMEEVDDGFYFG